MESVATSTSCPQVSVSTCAAMGIDVRMHICADICGGLCVDVYVGMRFLDNESRSSFSKCACSV